MMQRREWLRNGALGTVWLTLHRGSIAEQTAEQVESEVINIGSRRELLVDSYLLAEMQGTSLKLHRPEPKEVVLVCDSAWEGNTSAYFTIFEDESQYRMYYRGSHYDEQGKKAAHPEFVCYAESSDGLKWTKPNLGIVSEGGSAENNILLKEQGVHNFAPFKDGNPRCNPGGLYKALATGQFMTEGKSKACLDAYESPDGIHWRKSKAAVITEGAFDSQNLAFWDTERQIYRAYWRFFDKGVRSIRTATSTDFVHWEEQKDLEYLDSPVEHLYTNAIRPYFRAPHIYLGFPTRYQPSTQQVEPVFMSSRDGVTFFRWNEELIPISAPEDRDGNRSNYMTNGLLHLPGDKSELSVFATEAYYEGPGSRVRRFTFRMDGFVSMGSPQIGTASTRPLIFSGSRLVLNVQSRRSLIVAILDGDGKPFDGFAAEDCVPIVGDHIETVVAWKRDPDLRQLAGQPVRLDFQMNDADLYSFQFQE